MKKIQTIFDRDWDGNRGVVDKIVVPDFDFDNAIATEKLDGTNVRLTVRSFTLVRLEKRKNPSKLQKNAGIEWSWYVDAHSDDSADKYIWDAATELNLMALDIPDGSWPGEAVGPKIQGNPLNLENRTVYLFSLPHIRDILRLEDAPRTFSELRTWLPRKQSNIGNNVLIEGIVWHDTEGNAVKIKTKDFRKHA